MDDLDINKVSIFNKITFDNKYFKYVNGYKGDRKVKLLYLMLPKLSKYIRNFNETSFLIKDDDLFKMT